MAVSVAPAFPEGLWHWLPLMLSKGGPSQVQASWEELLLRTYLLQDLEPVVFELLHTGNEVALGKVTGRSPNSSVSFLGSTQEPLNVVQNRGSA